MDKTTRFTLREIYEAAATYQPEIRYKTLYCRFRKAKASGELPENATINSMTWEHALVILRKKGKTAQRKPRQEAINILRQYIRTDGLA